MTTLTATIVHVSIARDWKEVYAFAAKPETMPQWASGLAAGLTPSQKGWIAHGPLGDIHIHFAPPNDFGVIDHVVTLPNGDTVNNALRVVPNGTGSEVMFTLLKQPGMDDEQFRTDKEWVLKDLTNLKALLERKETDG